PDRPYLTDSCVVPIIAGYRLRCQPLMHLLDKTILETLRREGHIDQGGKVASALAAAVAVLWEPPVHLSTDLLLCDLDAGSYLGIGPSVMACRICSETIGSAAIGCIRFQV